jgi:dUTPase
MANKPKASKAIPMEEFVEQANTEIQETGDFEVKSDVTVSVEASPDELKEAEKIISEAKNNPLPEYRDKFKIKNESDGNQSPEIGKTVYHKICANLKKGFQKIEAGDVGYVPTGLFITTPVGCEVIIRTSRKVLLNKKLNVITIKNDGTGQHEIVVPIQNLSSVVAMINHGDEIGVMHIAEVESIA